MIWCRFRKDGRKGFGLVEGSRVRAINGEPFADYELTDLTFDPAAVELLPPTLPSTFYCVGMNYRAHIVEAKARGNTSASEPDRPEIGYRANNALIGHDHQIEVPPDLIGALEAEPEAVAVIGKKLRRASRDEAADGIFGWTIGNDVSARLWQSTDRTFWRAKNSDTFKPMGPWIVTDADPMKATTQLRVNQRTVASFKTGDMIFDAMDYIEEISKYITMFPGDVLWMGAAGSAPITPGDVVEIEINGIGTLRNPVVPSRN